MCHHLRYHYSAWDHIQAEDGPLIGPSPPQTSHLPRQGSLTESLGPNNNLTLATSENKWLSGPRKLLLMSPFLDSGHRWSPATVTHITTTSLSVNNFKIVLYHAIDKANQIQTNLSFHFTSSLHLNYI